ncbi:MAG: class E sortase, partial [Kineosporiaceae bacterium]
APLGTLTIERIGLDAVVVDGVSREDLQRGPGRIPGTAVPGEGANSVVAGHRTTWGAPFARLDEMRLGDRVVWTTTSGSITYEVVAAASGAPVAVVSPTDRSVTEQRPGLDAVTLVTCHPRFSAAERLVVVAHRVDPPIGADPPPGASVPAAPVAGALTRPAPDVPWTALVPPGVLVVALWVLGEVMAARPGRGGRARLPQRVAWRAATWAAALVPLLVTFDRLADLVPEGV